MLGVRNAEMERLGFCCQDACSWLGETCENNYGITACDNCQNRQVDLFLQGGGRGEAQGDQGTGG